MAHFEKLWFSSGLTFNRGWHLFKKTVFLRWKSFFFISKNKKFTSLTHQHQYLTTECLVLMVDILMRKINQVTGGQKQEVGLVLPA